MGVHLQNDLVRHCLMQRADVAREGLSVRVNDAPIIEDCVAGPVGC